MAVGLTPTKGEINNTAGALARTINQTFQQVQQLKNWLDLQSDQELIDLGYTQADVTLLRSSFADLDQLRTIYQGNAALAAAKNFRADARRIFGFGF